MIPSPWKPAYRIKEANDYCHQIYKELIPQLSEKLNSAHNASYPMRYWQILIGHWLLFFIGVLYDRYKRIESALNLFPDSYTHALPYEQCYLASYDTHDLLSSNGKINDDYYNLKVFSLISNILYPEKIVEINIESDSKVHKNNNRENSQKERIFNVLANLLLSKGKIILSGMSFLSRFDMFQIKWKGTNSIGFKDFEPINMETTSKDTYDVKLREALKLIGSSSNNFLYLLYRLIPYAIPVCYMENYEFYKDKFKPKRSIKWIGSLSGGWYFNEGFKFFAAEAAANGAKLLDFQHGGGYGVDLSIPHEELCLEKEHFFTWGWKTSEESKVKPLSVPSLSGLVDKYRCSSNNVLFISTSFPKYHYRFESHLQPEDMWRYIDAERRFLKLLKNEIVKSILYRPYVEDEWNAVEKIKTEYPELPLIMNGKLVDLMKKAKMVVIDHPHTSFLEALTINVPSIFYWDHNVYLMRPEAEEYFELLRKAGILYREPEDAAYKINEIYSDPLSWWRQHEVQAARNKFCQRFALTSKDWQKEWIAELKSLLADGG